MLKTAEKIGRPWLEGKATFEMHLISTFPNTKINYILSCFPNCIHSIPTTPSLNLQHDSSDSQARKPSSASLEPVVTLDSLESLDSLELLDSLDMGRYYTIMCSPCGVPEGTMLYMTQSCAVLHNPSLCLGHRLCLRIA